MFELEKCAHRSIIDFLSLAWVKEIKQIGPHAARNSITTTHTMQPHVGLYEGIKKIMSSIT